MNYIRAFAFALLLAVALPAAAAFAAPSEARTELEATINSVLNELKKPGLRDPGQRAGIMANVERIILTMFDFNELSVRTVGANWKEFSGDQKKRFNDAFTDLLRETYLEKLIGYSGEQVAFIGEDASSDGKRIEIKTTVTVKSRPVAVSYRLLQKGRWVAYDVIIEGVSMVQNYRNQFQDMLAKGDIEGLIRQVSAKADAMREFNKKQSR